MRVTAQESGNGDLTVKQLCEKLQGLPDNAVLIIHAGDSQLDGKYWSVSASWDPADREMGIINLRGRDHTGEANDWSNPYKGQFGDH